MSGKLFAALEQEQVLNTNPDTIDAKLAEASTEVSDGVIETGEDVAAIENMVLCLENATEVADDLQTDADTIEGTVEAGDGLDEAGAGLATESLSRALRKLGAPANMASVPSLESFGSKQSRVTASKIALEGFVETIKSTWKMIIDGLKALWQKIWDFFAKFFDNTDRVTKLAKKLRDKVAAMSGTAKNNQVKGRAHAQAFSTGTGAVTIGDISTIFGNHNGVTDGFLVTTTVVEGAGKVLEAGMKAKEGSEEEFFKVVAEEGAKIVDKIAGSSGVTKKETTVKEGDKDVTATAIGPFVNNSRLVLTNGSSFSVKMEENAKKSVSDTSPTLTQKECNTVLDMTVALMNKTEEYKKKKSSIDAASKSLIKIAESVVSSAEKFADMGENNALRAKLTIGRRAIGSFGTQFGRLVTLLPAANVRLGKAALSYVSASAAAHGSEAKK